MTTNNDESILLNERLWSVFPVTQPAFLKLLGLLDIRSSREIPTACVTFGSRSRLLINPDFVAKWCNTDRSLVMLVLHELYHIVLGHTRLWDRSTPTLNLAFDAVINAQLCLLFPQPEWTALFRHYYPADVFPLALLRPPEGWGSDDVRWLNGSLGTIHKSLYTDTSVSYEALFHLLDNAIRDSDENALNTGYLIGSHKCETDMNRSEQPPPDILEEIRNIISEWPLIEVRSGRDRGGNAFEQKLILKKAKRKATLLIQKTIFKLANNDAGGVLLPIIEETHIEGLLPYATRLDRKAIVRQVAGEYSFFYKSHLSLSSRTRANRVHIYLDVSGSMKEVIGQLYAALLPVLDWIEPQIHLFSSHIADIDHAQLRQGIQITDGGTDIYVVTQHILAHKIRRAVILTDGWVGNIPDEHMIRLKRNRIKLHCLVTHDGDASFGTKASVELTYLPALH